MFHFPAFASTPYAFRCRYPFGWVSPFGDPRIEACLPAPLGISQATTSFIASRRQGIHRAPLVASSPRPRPDTCRSDARCGEQHHARPIDLERARGNPSPSNHVFAAVAGGTTTRDRSSASAARSPWTSQDKRAASASDRAGKHLRTLAMTRCHTRVQHTLSFTCQRALGAEAP